MRTDYRFILMDLLIFPWLFLLFVNNLSAQLSKIYPKEVELVLQKAEKNRIELEKAIAYFDKQGDQQKLDGIYFLIANMDIHYWG